jgi:hypothetical protein
MGMNTRNPALLRRGLFGLAVVASAALALATGTLDSAGKQTADAKPLLAGSDVPAPVRASLERACQDCHFARTVWPWYAHIPPISWQVHSDVLHGRAFLDLSKWNEYTENERRGYRVAIRAAAASGVMPPAKYLWVHRDARLSRQELELLKAWASAR